MEIKAEGKYLRGSPRKVRAVANLVVGMSAVQAINTLKLLKKKPKKEIIKIIKQAIANAKNNFKVSEPEKMKIVKLLVNEGPRLKRIDKSHGVRFDRGIIQKKFYHLKIVLKSQEENGKEN